MENTYEHAPPLLAAPLTKLLVPLLLVLVDVAAAALCLAGAVLLRENLLPQLLGLAPFSPVRDYVTLWPALALLVAVRALHGLYPGYGLNPAEELRRQTVSVVLVAFFVLAGGTLFRFSADYSRTVLVLASFALLFLLPLVRSLVKSVAARWPIYGEGIWVVSRTGKGDELIAMVRSSPALGLRVVGRSEAEPPRDVTCAHCLVVPDQIDNISRVLDDLNARFRHVWLVPNLLDVSSVWVTPRDLQGHLALELRNNLLQPVNRIVKRLLELTILLVAMPLLLPLLAALALVVAFDSPGPVFFRQHRVGRGGRSFEILKFRTMRLDADILLRAHLAADAAAEQEWRRYQKLRHDPRLTRSGRLLRRLSLDELPQVWNIVRGEMSLVGPRAIVESELELYGERAHLYTAVVPGLTGLWQVSGRSHLSYNDRVRLDAYYVRNWSIWLDLAVLAKTPLVVVRAHGAY
jgi:Undecaprenyl-phosphate galactose phosphotransferase WbaP